MSAHTRNPRRTGLAAVLFLATIGTTVAANGVAYSATLLSILVAHEMGHYVVARRLGAPATLPLFIPVPPAWLPLGTLGAVIQMEEPEGSDRRKLLAVGASGPIAGFVVAVPAMMLGLALSEPGAPEAAEELVYFGDSLLSWALQAWVAPPLAPGMELMAHPVFVAAWAGFLVTALNLLPMGQLDGGHILRAAVPERAGRIARGVFWTLVTAGTLGLLVHFSDLISAPLGQSLAFLRPWLSPGLAVWAGLAWLTTRNNPQG